MDGGLTFVRYSGRALLGSNSIPARSLRARQGDNNCWEGEEVAVNVVTTPYKNSETIFES